MDSPEGSGFQGSGAGDRAAEAAQKAREYASNVVDQQKRRAAAGLNQFSTAIRDSAGRLQDERDATLAGYAEVVADRLSSAAGYLETSEPNRLLADAQSFARRRPEIVIGGMFVAGVALARLLKSGGPLLESLAAPPAEDTYVPHSKREQPHHNGGAKSQIKGQQAPGMESPRGVRSEAIREPGTAARRVEAAGGGLGQQHERPSSESEQPKPNSEMM